MSVHPKTEKAAFIAASADIIGDVVLGEDSSVWYQAVIRGTGEDEGVPIRIGARTNIQDGCILHLDTHFPLTIGNDVTVGHRAILHGCTIGNNCLIGMGAIVMNGAVIGDNCIVGAGALVTQGTKIPDSQLVLGSPAKIKREVTAEEISSNSVSAIHYVKEAKKQRD